MIKRIFYHPRFKKKLKNLPIRIKQKAKKQMKFFCQDPFRPSLKTHSLKGKLRGYWSFRINREYRILFEFIDEKTVGLIDIGTHSIYR